MQICRRWKGQFFMAPERTCNQVIAHNKKNALFSKQGGFIISPKMELSNDEFLMVPNENSFRKLVDVCPHIPSIEAVDASIAMIGRGIGRV